MARESTLEIQVYTDSEWEGFLNTRRSKYGSCLTAHWSRTEVSVALSSAEAELNASVKAACEALGTAQMLGHSAGHACDTLKHGIQKDEALGSAAVVVTVTR